MRATPETRLREEWSVTNDLLALLIEVESVTASGRQIRKPIELPRPKTGQSGGSHRTTAEKDAAMKKAINVLAATSKQVSR